MNYVCVSNGIYVCQGTWRKIKDLDEALLNAALGIGDLWNVSVSLWFYGLVIWEKGEFGHLKVVIDKLYEIGDTYDFDQSIIYARGLNVYYLLEERDMHGALSEAERGVSYARKKGIEISEIASLSRKAEVQCLAGDVEGAHDTISQASELYEKKALVVMPYFIASYMAVCFFIEIEALKNAIASHASSDVAQIRKRAYNAGKAAVKNSRKYAPYRVKILRLMGLYYWLIGKQGKALKWWGKSIQEGERLGARLDLSRTYFEVGKRLLEPQSKYKELNGINAQSYLEKARVMFEEMGLERDLDDLERLKAEES
jgi:hypothetical protein